MRKVFRRTTSSGIFRWGFSAHSVAAFSNLRAREPYVQIDELH
jgi:hypothetical protein